MKLLMAFASSFIFVTGVFAQDSISIKRDEVDIKNVINECKYIIEATVIKIPPCYGEWNDKSRVIYTSYLMQIHKLLKGDLECGTVEFVQLGGTMKDWYTINGESAFREVDYSMNRKLHLGQKGIFICGDSHLPVSGEKVSNKNRLSYWRLFQYHLDDNTEHLVTVDPKHTFDTISDFYNYFLSLGYLKLQSCDSMTFVHTPMITGHEYRMIHDSVYKHRNDSIELSFNENVKKNSLKYNLWHLNDSQQVLLKHTEDSLMNIQRQKVIKK